MRQAILGFFVGLTLAAMPALLPAAQSVVVVFMDGSTLDGTLLGVDQGVLTLQTADGKSEDIYLRHVKRVFDENGNVMHFGAPAPVYAPVYHPHPYYPVSRPYQPVYRRGNGARGRKVAADVLVWSGVGVMVVGAVIGIAGAAEEGDATATYYSGTGYNSSGQYVDYQISGYPGYYTASQYNDYYDGQAAVDTGIGVFCVGAVVTIVGACIEPSGRELREDALLHLEDGQLSMGVPRLSVGYHGNPNATLLTASF
ncbi:MAG TPA: hypothetical protein VK786_03140 [bacterium]|nr:hypothetical protein [bacterium]